MSDTIEHGPHGPGCNCHEARLVTTTEVQGGPHDGLGVGVVDMTRIALVPLVSDTGHAELDSRLHTDDLTVLAQTAYAYARDHGLPMPASEEEAFAVVMRHAEQHGESA